MTSQPKFKFGENYSSVINARVSKTTHEQIKFIAKRKNIAIQEVVRVFLEVALKEYILEESLKADKV